MNGTGEGDMHVRSSVAVAALLALAPSALRAAPSCDEFSARFIEGAAYYKSEPQFKFDYAGLDETGYWTITTFSNVRSMMICSHGLVRTFAVDANDASISATTNIKALTTVGFYANGLDGKVPSQCAMPSSARQSPPKRKRLDFPSTPDQPPTSLASLAHRAFRSTTRVRDGYGAIVSIAKWCFVR
jgi:hypothetical protein